jgi:hypothetical protein
MVTHKYTIHITLNIIETTPYMRHVTVTFGWLKDEKKLKIK